MSTLDQFSPGRIWALAFAVIVGFWGAIILVGCTL